MVEWLGVARAGDRWLSDRADTSGAAGYRVLKRVMSEGICPSVVQTYLIPNGFKDIGIAADGSVTAFRTDEKKQLIERNLSPVYVYKIRSDSEYLAGLR